MSQAEFFWKIVTYDGETYLVTPRAADNVQKLLAKGTRHVNISQHGKTITIATAGIKLIAESDTIITDDDEKRMVESGEINLNNHAPLTRIDETGAEVACWHWAKKIVSAKEWNEKAGRGYYKVGNYYDSGRVWVGFKKILEENQILPEDVDWCTPEETKKLDVMDKGNWNQ